MGDNKKYKKIVFIEFNILEINFVQIKKLYYRLKKIVNIKKMIKEKE